MPGWDNFLDHLLYIKDKVPFESSLKIDTLTLLLVINSEHSCEDLQINELIERFFFPVDSAVKSVLSFSFSNKSSHIADRDSQLRHKRVTNKSIFLLFFKGFKTIREDFCAKRFISDSVINEVLSAPGNPTKIYDKFSIAGVNFVEIFLVVSVIIGAVDDEGSKDQVALLLSTITFDKESPLSNDTI